MSESKKYLGWILLLGVYLFFWVIGALPSRIR